MMIQHRSDESTLVDVQPARPRAFVRPTPVVSYALIGANVLVYVAMVASGISAVSPTPEDALRWGADFGPLTMHGQWWRIFTSMFVHFGIIHIALNMYALYQVGPFTEALFRRVRFLGVYLIAGLGGSLASLAINPLIVSAGASGAIFGIFGGLLGFLLIHRSTFPADAARRIAKSTGIVLVINLIYGLSVPGIDVSAHVGGLVTGFLAGCLLAGPSRSGFSNRPV
jgi:rhomboid protease GluP